MKYKEIIEQIAKKDKLLSIILTTDLQVKVTQENIQLVYTNKEMFSQASKRQNDIVGYFEKFGIKKPIIILYNENRKDDLEKIKKILQQPKIKNLMEKLKVSKVKSVKLIPDQK